MFCSQLSIWQASSRTIILTISSVEPAVTQKNSHPEPHDEKADTTLNVRIWKAGRTRSKVPGWLRVVRRTCLSTTLFTPIYITKCCRFFKYGTWLGFWFSFLSYERCLVCLGGWRACFRWWWLRFSFVVLPVASPPGGHDLVASPSCPAFLYLSTRY